MITLYEDLIKLKNSDSNKYIDFNAKLIPNIKKESIIGIKIPILRKYAKDLYKINKRLCIEFINSLPHNYLEENIIHGFLCSLMSTSINELFDYLDIFLPYVDNWAVCDTINTKIFKKYPNEVRVKLNEYLKSEKPFVKRFAIVSFLQYYLDDYFNVEDLYMLGSIKSDDYYVNMALAWYFSFAFIKKYDETLKLFVGNELYIDKFVYNKSIQKACESFRIDNDKKEYLKKLKLK